MLDAHTKRNGATDPVTRENIRFTFKDNKNLQKAIENFKEK